MSTIVAVQKNDEVAMAWDSMTTVGSTRNVNLFPVRKVLQVGDSLVGVAGLSVYYTILEHYFREEEAPRLDDETLVLDFFLRFLRDLRDRYSFVNDQSDSDDPSPFADLCAEFVVGNRNGIFRVKEILSIGRFSRFCAIGSGSPHAEGALQVLYSRDMPAEEIAREAVLVAVEFDRASGGEVMVLKTR